MQLWDGLPAEAKKRTMEEAAKKLPVGHVGTPDALAEAYLFLMK